MHLNLSYGHNERQKLDLYTVRNRTKQRGVIIYLYGGSWRKGDRKLYRFLASTFNRRGFSFVVPDYRVFPEIRYPDFMHDAANAIAWIHNNAASYDLPLNRVFLMGHSAGAHMGALLLTNARFLEEHGLNRRDFDGFIGLAGPYGINPLNYNTTKPIFAAAEPIADAQPTEHVQGSEPPMLLLHGDADSTVYPINTTHLETQLQGAGSRAKSIIYPDIGHVGILTSILPPFRWRAPVLKDVLSFLDEHAPSENLRVKHDGPALSQEANPF